MAEHDYGELFCEAVDTIIKERLQSIPYDSTILCTIVDDSLRDQGEYTVSNGSSQFQAYSSVTNYRKNNNVYVQIPQGDWKAQKYIVGKKTNENEKEMFVYKNPFSSLVDVTGNLIKLNIPNVESGMVANDPNESYVTLWSYNSDNEDAKYKQTGITLSSYTRLGIQAQFKSLLNPVIRYENNQTIRSKAVQGQYGLRLRLWATKDRTIAQEDEANTSENFYCDLELNVEDMNGNPYDFHTFFQQEKVFDISSIRDIKAMALQFYQKPGSFKDEYGVECPYTVYPGDNLLPDNLFVQDVYIALGYDVSEFDDEMVSIYSFNPTTYLRTAPTEENIKELVVRWIHKQPDGSFKSISSQDDLDFKVYWYRYQLGAQSADQYSGVYWTKWSEQIKDENGNWVYNIIGDDWKNHNTSDPEIAVYPKYFTSYLIPDVAQQSEMIKAIIIYNNKPYRSNILTFENEANVANLPTVDVLSALTIHCEDGSNGNYRIYNPGGSLVNEADSKQERMLDLYFNPLGDKPDNPDDYKLTDAVSVEWIIPVDKSMILLDSGYDTYIQEDGYYHIIRYKGDDLFTEQPYYIRGYYSEGYSNNTITCQIVKEKGAIYVATKTFTFGQAGTTGTDVTLVIDFKDITQQVVDITKTDAIFVTARLYDASNNDITGLAVNNGCTFTWGWKENNNSSEGSGYSSGYLTVASRGDDYPNEATLSRNSVSAPMNTWNILTCIVDGWGDYTLTAYFPIPLMQPSGEMIPLFIEGASRIIYTTLGEPEYYRYPYKLYGLDKTWIEDITWSINVGAFDVAEWYYLPSLITESTLSKNALKALSFYIKGISDGVVVQATYNGTVVWSQPLLIMQNNYFSTTLNKWDGSVSVNEEDGSILAPRMAAGKKNEDNTFSGVIMGDWSSEDTHGIEQTGIYGFDDGAASFGFMEDGTAFIGKSDKGRIEFDGETGIIRSANYDTDSFGEANSGGMIINLTEGSIQADYFTLLAGMGSVYEPIYDKDGILSGYETVNRLIRIDSTQPIYPVQVGSRFSISWDGSIRATNGNFTGIINATGGKISGDLEVTGTLDGGTFIGSSIYIPNESNPAFSVTSSGVLKSTSGTIGGWNIGTTTLKDKNEKVTLDSSTGIISGATIKAGELQSNTTDNLIKLNGYIVGLNENMCQFGEIKSDYGDGRTEVDGMGIKYTGGHQGRLLVTSLHVGMASTYGHMVIDIDRVLIGAKNGNPIRLDAGDNGIVTIYPELNIGNIKIKSDGTTEGIYATLA